MAQFKVAATGESESQFRQFLGQLFTQRAFRTARNGVLGGTGLGVTQTTTASGSVMVDAGIGIVQDTILAGAIPLISENSVTLDVFGPNPLGGLPRNDIVVFDSADATIKVLYGAANAVPTDPTIPTTVLPLARLRHNPTVSSTTIPTSQIEELRTYTATRGGLPVVSSQADRDTVLARTGTAVYRSDTDNIEIYDGNVWDVFSPGLQPKTGRQSVTVSGTGYATITHGAGFKPSQIVAQPEFAYSIGIDQDQITSTTFIVRLLTPAGVAPTGATKVSYVCYP